MKGVLRLVVSVKTVVVDMSELVEDSMRLKDLSRGLGNEEGSWQVNVEYNTL